MTHIYKTLRYNSFCKQILMVLVVNPDRTVPCEIIQIKRSQHSVYCVCLYVVLFCTQQHPCHMMAA